MRRRLQKSRPSASTAGLQAADETMPNAEFFNDGRSGSTAPGLYFSPAPPAPLPVHAEAKPALCHHRGSPPARARPQQGLPARRRGRSGPLLRMAAASGTGAPDGGYAGGHFGS